MFSFLYMHENISTFTYSWFMRLKVMNFRRFEAGEESTIIIHSQLQQFQITISLHFSFTVEENEIALDAKKKC